MDIREIEIPIFLHPHLFWIFWRRDIKKRLQLQNDLSKECNRLQPKDENFEIGELVMVKKNLICKRAIIEEKLEDSKYEVWLIDYGHLEHSSTVYKLNPKFNLDRYPPLVHQASLWNVVFLNEDLNIEKNSIDQHRNPLPNAGATLNALQFMGNYQLFFKIHKEVNGILFGDILYKKDGETTSLTKSLIDKKLMVEDAELFSKVESNRVSDKVFHLAALRAASKKHEDSRFSFDLSLLMDEVFMRNASRGISVVNDVQSQSHETKSSAKDVPISELMRSMRKKAEIRKMETLSCTESEMEETVIEANRKSSSNVEKPLSRAMRLKNLINRRRSALEVGQSCTEEVTSGSEATSGVSGSTVSVTSKLAAMKQRMKRLEEKNANAGDDRKDEPLKENIGEPKILQGPHAVYLPGGIRDRKKVKVSDASTTSGSKKNTTNLVTSSNCESDQSSKDACSGSAKERNLSHLRINMMKKRVSRSQSVLSNTTDASDVGEMGDRAPQKNLSGINIDKNPPKVSTDNTSSEIQIASVDNKSPSKEEDSVKKVRINVAKEDKWSSSESMESEEEVKETENGIKTELVSGNDSKCNHENAADSQMVIKPYCNCDQCQFWTKSEGWDIGRENFTEEEKCKRQKMRPSSLMLKEQRKEDVKLASIEYRFMTKIEKDASFKILVHGRLIPQPIDLVVEAPFHSVIHRSLKKLKYIRTKKVQSYIWPAISRSMNVCFIHRKQSGKTLAYLPPVCSFLLEKEDRYNDLKKGGPIAIILGKSSSECEDVYDLANKLMEGTGHNKPRTLLVTYPFQYVNLSSVDMLITIPPILIELLKRNATNLKRLCHLVLENIDVLLEKYPEEMKSTVAAIESMLLQRSTRQGVQMIMGGEHWTLKVEKFLSNLRDIPLVSIGDYLEASIYGGIKLKVKLLEAKAKCDATVDILRDVWKFHKSIIVCNTNEEINQLKTSLDLASISYIAVTDDLPAEQISQYESNWESHCAGQFIVLICTDLVLHTMLSITSASLIIHFSLPPKWSFWIKRFYCLLENYKSPLTKSNDKLKCEGYILTDELCVDQIPRLLKLLKNYNVSLQQFEPVCKQLEIEREEVKINDQIPLCTSLKQFGYCHTVNCPERHLLDRELDCNNSLPQNGTIKYKIVKLIDVNHLKVNIVEHRDTEGKITGFKSQKFLDDEKLTSMMNQKKVKVENIDKQSSYAYWDEEDFNDMFRECIVENIKTDVVDILVKSSGKRTTVSKSKIFQLPEGFSRDKDEESSHTEIIIANFKPPYKDEKFSARSFFKLNSYIEDIAYDDNFFASNICLQLENTIWVNTVNEEVNVYDLKLTKSNLTKELVKRQLAELNLEHMDNLYALCKEAGIVLPKYNVPVEEQIIREPPQTTPQWAFLDMDFCNKVYFSSAVTPDEIYVRLVKFDTLLHSLEKDLIDVALRQGSKQDFAIIQGRYYLAKDPLEDKFIRVLLKKVEDGKALCFSVDYGDEFIVPLGDIRYLSNYMIQKLPFQAIHCRLFGIAPIEGDWSVEAVDVLYQNFTFEADSDIYKTLYAKCVLYEKGMNKGQSFFSIMLKDVWEKPILINQLLVDCGWAEVISGFTLDDFEVPVVQFESEGETSDFENDEVEKIKEIVNTSNSISSNQVMPKGFAPRDRPKFTEENNDLEFFCGSSGDEVDNFIEFMTAMTKNSMEQTHPVNTHNALPAIEAAPFEVDYLTPDVYWSQTRKTVDLHIKLPNVQNYNVKLLKSRIFNLETTVDEKKYVVNLVLYESVEKNFKHNLGGLEIKVTLTKNKEEEWPKLSRSKKRLRNVYYMLSKEEMEDKDDKKLFLDFGEEFHMETDNESDGAIFDVYTDEDSEYEQEIPDDIIDLS
ncbi:putative ATP-dependent RNA helicase TDRD12 [Coccinella septempunctata]|uniref:putative ATP-dependent RNA helicase TDRD12 n=1 Tax=Coccinella septempunctata TaxID=41139 RepID=UPI001D098B38|nr:putative ATP-dependent RNA helicase TDRD12 [Coccinella septempunctata]